MTVQEDPSAGEVWVAIAASSDLDHTTVVVEDTMVVEIAQAGHAGAMAQVQQQVGQERQFKVGA
jgi:hypothetical protein